MILRGGSVAVAPDRAEVMDVAISGGRVCAMGRALSGPSVDCSGRLILPGLVNAHDHLEFNLFSRLGKGPYRNAGEWARDIHRSFRDAIEETLAVPLSERLYWGAIKNLLSGVTTVCHHNPWSSAFSRRFPVRVVRDVSWAHSLEFSSDLQTRHSSCARRQPFVFHAGEATGVSARREMEALAKLGMFSANSVMVHAVGLTRNWLHLALERRCSVVWCPSSNLFTLGRTLSRRVLDSGLTIALGTDSTLTAVGDMSDELRVALRVSGLSPERLYGMVTDEPAKALRLRRGEGSIRIGGVADLAIFRLRAHTPAQTLLRQRPEAVMVGGRLEMVAAEFAPAWRTARISRLSSLRTADRTIFLRVPPPVHRQSICLAGRRVES